jgi:hypothetical protein
VGVLWITGGLMWDIPHRESTPAFFDMNIGPSAKILTIFENHIVQKLVDANKKIFFKGGKPCDLKGALDKRKIKELGESRRIWLCHPS